MPFFLETAFGISSESITSLFNKSGPPELPVTNNLPRSDSAVSRCALRERFPDVLTPDQMYGDIT